uniref:Secreted protein n=1 Tax=Hypomyces aurantius TaxID=29852 RepID=A0A168RAT8_9HYPO|nr:hypothetical protein [Hypomyces aurantius]ANC62709.1 hypothetical protein [Hypomyces aurantius]
MIKLILFVILLSNAVNLRRDVLILYNRIAELFKNVWLNGISSLTLVTQGLDGGILSHTFKVLNSNYTYIYKKSINLLHHSTLSTLFTRLSMGAILAHFKIHNAK